LPIVNCRASGKHSPYHLPILLGNCRRSDRSRATLVIPRLGLRHPGKGGTSAVPTANQMSSYLLDLVFITYLCLTELPLYLGPTLLWPRLCLATRDLGPIIG
jgi:hypothetical protein